MLIPANSKIDYAAVVKEIHDADGLATGMPLLDKLSDHWFQAYRRQVARKTNVTDMYANGFTYPFDLEGSDHGDGLDPQPPGMFPRVVAA